MKKLSVALALAFCICMPFVAQDKEQSTPIWDHGDNVSPLTYQNVEIYRVMDSKDAYVVLYAKGGYQVGQVTLPKAWMKEEPRKLEFREKARRVSPYMTVIKQDGNFLKVWLNVTTDKRDPIWGLMPNGAKIEGTDADTLTIEY